MGGIYQIRNTINNDVYIGSAIDFYQRKKKHFNSLKNNSHHSKYLQNAINKYNIENFVFEKLATCPNEYLLKLEQWFINEIKPKYNICITAGSSLGLKRSKESKVKYSIAQTGNKKFLGKTHSNETKAKFSKIRKGIIPVNAIKASSEKRKVKLVQMDLLCNEIKVWNSVKEAGLALNIPPTNISKAINGKLKIVGKFKWRCVEDNLSFKVINNRYLMKHE